VVDLLHHRPLVGSPVRVVAACDGTVLAFCYASVSAGVGHLDGFAVAAGARRRGIASALLRAVCHQLAASGCRSVETGGTTWHYAWPGIDREYVAAMNLARHLGFRQQSVAYNMDVDLTGWVPGRAAAALTRGATPCPTVRRARPTDAAPLHDLISEHFNPVWDYEIGLALRRTAPGVFVAERDGRVLGFAAHGVYRPDLFGPLGTDPDERGTGIGQALLLACLDDMAKAGLTLAQISWIGPAQFYAKAVNARIGRTFVVLDKILETGSPTAQANM
jgi:mycothiol synthase